MIDLELELVTENPSWMAVLKAYQAAQEELAARQAEEAEQSAQAEKLTSAGGVLASRTDVVSGEETDDEADSHSDSEAGEGRSSQRKRATRWVQRVTKLQGIEAEDLSKIHGRLIAYDLLKCELAGRSDGMVYQLTSIGKEILARFSDEELTAAA
jgi:hypothetical protein